MHLRITEVSLDAVIPDFTVVHVDSQHYQEFSKNISSDNAATLFSHNVDMAKLDAVSGVSSWTVLSKGILIICPVGETERMFSNIQRSTLIVCHLLKVKPSVDDDLFTNISTHLVRKLMTRWDRSQSNEKTEC